MKDKQLLVLTEGSKNIGLGHINRVNNLLTAFRKENIYISWCIKGNEVLKLDIEDEISFINWDNDECLKTFESFDYIIVDTYLVKKEFLKKIVRLNKKILFIVDGKLCYEDSESNKNVFVLFSSAYATKEMVSDKVNFIGGIEFLLFNDFFYKVDVLNDTHNKEIQKIVINIGGFYDTSFVNDILKRIDKIYSHIQVDILGFSKEDNFELYKTKKNNSFKNNFHNGMDYVTVLNESDLIITNGGQSLNEAMFLGKPTIVIAFAENQIKNINYWNDLKLVRFLGNKEDQFLMNKLERELEKVKSFDERKLQNALDQKIFSRDVKEKIFNRFLGKNK